MTPYGITSVTGIKSTKCPLSPGWREQEHTLPISHISISFPLQRGYSPTVLLSSSFSSEKAYFTEILLPAAAQQCLFSSHRSPQQCCSFPLQSFSSFNAQHLAAAKILRAHQPGHPRAGLPVFQRRRPFAALGALPISKCILTIFTVYLIHFISDV